MEIQGQTPFVQGAGIITRAESEVKDAVQSAVANEVAEGNVRTTIEPTPSTKEEFDPNITTKGLVESNDLDGGKFVARSTGPTALLDAASTDKYQFRQPEQPEAYELTGFTASYMSGSSMASTEPRVFFKTAEEAQAAVVNNCYTHTYSGGTMKCNIIKDAPIICVNDMMRFQYLDGAWKRTR